MAINTSPDNYVLGKGRFYFAKTKPDGTLEGFRFIGNVPAFSLTPSSDTLTHVSSTGGINVTDRDIVISSDLAIGFTTDNMTAENKALWSGGTVDTVVQTSGTALTDTVVIQKGYSFPVGETTAAPSGVKNITVTSITVGGTPLVANTDYTVNGPAGLILFPTTGAALEGSTATVTYSVAASTRDVISNRAATITGAVKFISDNPDTGKGVVNEEHYLPLVRLAADGDWSLIGDDWQSFGFTGTVLQKADQAGNPIPRHTITPIIATP